VNSTGICSSSSQFIDYHFSQGDAVLLDLRHLGEKKINERLPMVRELAQAYAGVDPGAHRENAPQGCWTWSNPVHES
jgi:succinate dehydrogenase/fumarate reductase flavoprotein subunit